MDILLPLDEETAVQLEMLAHETGEPLKQIVNKTLVLGLQCRQPQQVRVYRLKPAKLGKPSPGINLDKTLQLADALEGEAMLAKLEQPL